MSLTAGGRGHVEGGKTISRSAPSAFNLPPKPARSASGRCVREVGDYPPSRLAPLGGAPLRRAGPIFQFATEELIVMKINPLMAIF